MRPTAFIFALIFVSIPFIGTAQQISGSGPQTDWEIMPSRTNFATFFDGYHNGNYKNVTVHFDNGTVYAIHYEKRSFGIAFVDPKGNTKWETPTKDMVLGLARMGDNILCFYSQDLGARKMNNLWAALYDGRNGKLIKEKQIETNSEDLNMEPKLLSANNEFVALLIRYVPVPKKTARNPLDAMLMTDRITATKFNADLTTEKTVVRTVATNGKYAGCYALSADEFAICSNQEGEIVVEKFSMSSLAAPEKVSFHLNVRKDSNVPTYLVQDPSAPKNLYVLLRYENTDRDRTIGIAKIDFATKKTMVKEIVCNKALAESLSDDAEAKKSKLGKDVDRMDIADVVASNDKIVLLTQVRYPIVSRDGDNTKFVQGQMMITAFDAQLSNPRSMIIDRNLEVFGTVAGERIASRLTGNTLELIYNRLDGVGKYAADYAQVDVAKMAIVTRQEIEHNDLRNGALIETDAVVWNNDKILLPYFNSNGLKNQEMLFRVLTIKR